MTKEEKRLYMKTWRAKNKNKIQAYKKQWVEENSEHVASYTKTYMKEYVLRDYAQNARFERGLLQNYGITEDDFLNLWENQEGKCLICDIHLVPRGRSMDSAAVDHNHLTGEIRGLLCKSCNSGLGHFKDNPEFLASAIEYLEEMGNYSQKHKRIQNG